jgi:hypothetical protein
VDRHWNLIAHNRMLPPLLQQVAPELLAPPANVLRASLHPRGLAPMVANLGAWREHVLQRLQRQINATGDAQLVALRRELEALPAPPAAADQPIGSTDVAVPLTLHTPLGTLNFITTITVFGAPHDVTLSELAIETLLPADAATAEALRRVQATLSP